MKTGARKSAADARVTLIEEDSGSGEAEMPPVKKVKETPKKLRLSSSTVTTPVPIDGPATPGRSPGGFRVELTEDERYPEPKRWKEAYDILVEQRKTIVAPVDTMGCTEAGAQEDEASRPDSDPRSKRYQTLTALMLSSQTKDPVTGQAVSNLRQQLPGGCTLESILAATDEQISACINKVGFWRRKTDYIMRTAVILKEEHGGDVPQTIDGLLALPGVGPKMGFLALQEAWGIQIGIGVDTHVHRISNRLRWVGPKKTEEAEQTRLILQSWLPKELHGTINKLLVGFGQTICLPLGPRCDLCHIGQVKGLCPSKQHVAKEKRAATNNAARKARRAAEEEARQAARLKIEVEPAIVDGTLLEGEILVNTAGETLEVRREGDEKTLIEHEETNIKPETVAEW